MRMRQVVSLRVVARHDRLSTHGARGALAWSWWCEWAMLFSLSPPRRLRVLRRPGDGGLVTGDGGNLGSNWTAGFHSRLGKAQSSSASNSSTGCWGWAAASLVGVGPAGVGGKLCRCCDTHRLPGARQYMGETGGIFAACQWNSSCCQARKHSATHSEWRFETASLW